MEQEKKARIMKISIITMISLAAIILLVLIIQILVLKDDVNTGSNVNTEKLNVTNQEQVATNNEVQDKPSNNEQNTQNNINQNEENVQTNTNQQEEEEVIVIKPIIDGSSGQNQNGNQLLSTVYYYNQLNASAKTIYDNLKENKEQLITGTYKFDFGTEFNTLLHTPNGEKELNEAFQSAWNAFSYDESDLFYIDVSKMTLLKEERTIGGITTHHVSIGPGNNANYLKSGFQTQEQITNAQTYLENIVAQIVAQTEQNTPVEKAKMIHDWLIAIIEYSETGANRFHIYGALHDKKAVCEGYARSYKYLMEKVGVPCVLVSGVAVNTEGQTESHAWNYVQIDNNWYAVDVTWDDPVIVGGGQVDNNSRYRYFLKGSKEFTKDHVEHGTISENSMEFKYPVLSVNDYE